ncbi:protein lplB [Clostridium thermosuccinogenes]|uniref:Protein lplB n=2 Tax=Clostridium thermosuccinogenes TaxID=84032 RepID=A0A2K2F726_9CLOT|nr:protein lplB [Pseudoclostridium thermosuccinogenes]PNT91847.1 protein lplB [Pseudoclostridium thermosuccinogenes]PNT94423.1 protein lplB [Pseudoclostridium thermosuccinogenes]PNT94587.1 protein lplB [Pseudoclostridium thermosuccinogenes]
MKERRSHRSRFLHNIIKYRWQYSMILPGIIMIILFNYMPMVGLQIAFKSYTVGNTIWNAPWVGFKNFWFLTDSEFWRIVGNTLSITVLRFITSLPAPIILALLISEVKREWFKRTVQTVSYLPHFVSWIVVAYIIDAFLSPNGGIVNQIIQFFGKDPIFFMGEIEWFRPIVVISAIWKETGWNSIIYLAAIASINPELYESAKIEGAGKLAQLRYITLPCLIPTIMLLFTLSIPSILSAGTDQIYPLMNNANLEVSMVLDTYILINGLQQGYYSMASAVGLLSSTIGLILVLCSNKLAKIISGEGLW